MGRVIRREVVAFRCELRACPVTEPLMYAIHFDSSWHDHVSQLASMVDRGWSVVLTHMLRTYCPAHAERARACTCRTNPSRRHLCVVHSEDAAALVWDTTQTPVEVSEILKVAS